MKKLKSTLPNMVVVLTVTTLLAGFLLGYVNNATSEAREAVEQQTRLAALQEVAPQFDNDPIAEATDVTLPDGAVMRLYPTRLSGALTGAAVESFTDNGFSGRFVVMVGLNDDGSVRGYRVITHAETPGLGAKMTDWFKADGSRSVIGRNPLASPLKVSKDGGEVDAITAATITSRAFLETVNRAAEALKIYQESNI